MLEDYKKANVNPSFDEVSLKKVIKKMGYLKRYIFSKWLYFMIAAIIGTAIGYLYAKFKKVNYTAECTFVLEDSEKGTGISQYSALASMAGISMGGSSDLFQSDNIIQLYQSRLMLEKTLLSPSKFGEKTELLIDKYIEINKLRQGWVNDSILKKINFDIPRTRFTLYHDSIMGLVVTDINKNYLSVEKLDKKMSMIGIKVKATNPYFAKAFNEAMVSNVNTFYIQTKTKNAAQNVLLLQHQADSIHRILNSSITNAASASDANPNPDPAMIQVLKAPSERRKVEVQASTGIYSEVIRNLEIARSSLQREMPLLQVVDEPILPLPNDRISKSKSMIIGMIVAVFMCLLILLINKGYKQMVN